MATDLNGLYARNKRVFTEGAWVATGQVLRALGMLFGIRLLTSHVVPDVYGKFSLLAATLALVSGVFCYPFLHAVNRFYHEANRLKTIPILRRTIKKLLIGSTGALSAIIIAVGFIFTLIEPSAPLVTAIILAGLLCAEMFGAFETTFLTSARRQARYSAWVAIESWLKPCAALLIIWLWQPSVDAILLGYIIGIGLALMIFYRPCTNPAKNYDDKSSSKQPRLMRQIIMYAIPLFPLALVGWVSSLGDRYIVAGLLDYKDVGIYAAGYSIAFQPFQAAGGIVELTIRPIYFNAISNQDYIREKTAIKAWLILTAVICMFGIILIFFCHNWIADLLLGSKFRQASALMPWLAIGGGLFAIGQVLEKPFYGHMQTRYVLHTQLWGASASIVFCLLMISIFGLMGAAIAVPIYYGFQCLVAIYYNQKTLKD